MTLAIQTIAILAGAYAIFAVWLTVRMMWPQIVKLIEEETRP